jgi:DNA-binding CsgD family transcriptional regulator
VGQDRPGRGGWTATWLCAAGFLALYLIAGDFLGADASGLSGAPDDFLGALCAFCWSTPSADLLAFAATHRLSPRELQVARCAAAGTRSAEIATHLGISCRTVDTHLRHIYSKLDVHNRARLAYVLPR